MARKAIVNKVALRKFFDEDPGMQGILREEADELRDFAEHYMPDGMDRHRASFRANESFRVRKFRRHYRVYLEDPFAHLIEFGSMNNIVYAPLRLAAKSTGRRFVENMYGKDFTLE